MSEPTASGPVRSSWLAAMIRNYLDQDDAIRDAGGVIIQPPGDPLTIVVLQPGGNHLMVQVNPCDLVAGG